MFLWDFTSTKKTKFLIPISDLTWLQPVDRPGRPTCTDVHSQFWQEGWSTDPVDHPESSALWKGPGRPGGRPDRETCSLYPGSVGRPVDRWHNGLKYDRWRVGRTVDR